MLTESLSLIIIIGLLLIIFYILQTQKEILAQSNRNVRPKVNLNILNSKDQTRTSIDIAQHSPPPQNISDNEVDTKNETRNSFSADNNDQQAKRITQSGNQMSGEEDNEIQIVAKSSYGIFSYLPKINLFKTKKTEVTIQKENREKVMIHLRNNLLRHSEISTQSENFVIYKLQLRQISRNIRSCIQKFEFGKSKLGAYTNNEKVIMILGATGSGKTTLINSMINYVFGIEYGDKYRFKLVTEDGGGNQAFSQTSFITAYTIHHQNGFKVNHTLTIIDTPGFGDTRGIQRDAEITKQIHDFFTITGKEGIDHIDAVGFVAQSSLPRLTFTQKYIFDRILALFGKDLGENIYLLLTFADGKTPQVLNGIKEAQLPYQEHFKFNNSVIFDDNSTEDEFASMFWQMGMSSFAKFFSHFSTIKPKSLTQTKSVLEERERIETQIVGLQHEIQLGLNKLEQLKKEVEVVENHKADIARNEDFKYTVTEDSTVKHDLDPNTYVTNCLVCNFSCHKPCGIADNGDKYGCAAMDRGGKGSAKCTVCNNRCSWKQHKNMTYYFTTERKEVTKTSEDLKQRYLDANGKVKSANKIIEDMVDEFEAVQIKVVGITEILRRSINKLNEIALKPNPLSTGEYIDILIESEKANAELGFQDRISHLNEVKKKVENIAKIAEQGFDPFEVYKRKITQEKDNEEGVWSAVGSYLKKIDFL